MALKPFTQLKRAAKDKLKANEHELEWDRRFLTKRYPVTDRFIWILRERGTHLIPLHTKMNTVQQAMYRNLMAIVNNGWGITHGHPDNVVMGWYIFQDGKLTKSTYEECVFALDSMCKEVTEDDRVCTKVAV